jgi:hypothetical protein
LNFLSEMRAGMEGKYTSCLLGLCEISERFGPSPGMLDEGSNHRLTQDGKW